MMTNAKKLTSAIVAGLAVAATLAFAPAANAATPAEVVNAPSVGIADDGSYFYVPGEWSGDITALTIGWYSCPTPQYGAIGATHRCWLCLCFGRQDPACSHL
jgi:invasion protein IalB